MLSGEKKKQKKSKKKKGQRCKAERLQKPTGPPDFASPSVSRHIWTSGSPRAPCGFHSQCILVSTGCSCKFLVFTTSVCRKCYIKGEKDNNSNVLWLFKSIWFRNSWHRVRRNVFLSVSHSRCLILQWGWWRGPRVSSLCDVTHVFSLTTFLSEQLTDRKGISMCPFGC